MEAALCKRMNSEKRTASGARRGGSLFFRAEQWALRPSPDGNAEDVKRISENREELYTYGRKNIIVFWSAGSDQGKTSQWFDSVCRSAFDRQSGSAAL